MFTLRTYTSSVEAGLAKAHLDAAGITSELLDEATNSNTAAQFAVPVRLMVAENQAEEARKILDTEATTDAQSFLGR